MKKMKLLVIGSGGREHALVSVLAKDSRVSEIWCIPGNPGIAKETLTNRRRVKCLNATLENLEMVAEFAEKKHIDLTIVGGEATLVEGIADVFEKKGLKIFGPRQRGAVLEGSKIFSAKFMLRRGIPTPLSGWFHEVAPALRFAKELDGRCAVKADGLAGGKGVKVCRTYPAAEEAIRNRLEKKMFGEAGSRILIQKLVEGDELSVHILIDGKTFRILEGSRDYKNLRHEVNIKTGGMGAYSSPHLLTRRLEREVLKKIVTPFLKGCREGEIDFRGVLYAGIMLTNRGIEVLEFNVRFGDPEAEALITRIKDLLDVLLATAEGRLSEIKVRWSRKSSVCVVLASRQYPKSPEIHEPIRYLPRAEKIARKLGVKIFHSGTSKNRFGHLVASGGRVFAITGFGDSVHTAREKAYEVARIIRFGGVQFRDDIALSEA